MGLNKEQIVKATELLGLLCKSINLNNKQIASFFDNDNDEAIFVCGVLEQKGLLRITPADGRIVGLDCSNETCNAFKSDLLTKEYERRVRSEEMERIEIKLTKSNIEANKLNAKIAKQNSQNESKNRIAMWVNITVGVLNTVLLAIQIWLIVRK